MSNSNQGGPLADSNSNNNSIKQIVITNMVTLAISLSTAYVALQGKREEVGGGIYQSTLERMRAQDETISNLQAQITKANIRIIDLEAQVRAEVNHGEILQSYLDSVPTPAWIKRLNDDGLFEMYMINKKYSEYYGIAKNRYEGKTDYQVWPREIADAWHANDMRVYYTGGYLRSQEDIPVSGAGTESSETKEATVLKFTISLPLGEQGVGGMIIENNDRPRGEQ